MKCLPQQIYIYNVLFGIPCAQTNQLYKIHPCAIVNVGTYLTHLQYLNCICKLLLVMRCQ